MKEKDRLKIKLDEKYFITGDSEQWMLAYKGKNDKIDYDGYFATLEQLIKYYAESSLRRSNVKSITELIKFQKSLMASLNHALTPLKFKVIGVEVD